MSSSPAGTVPRAWPTVLRLALVAAPASAMGGLFALLTGKRVRGWNILCLAAAAHPDHYATWIRVAEPALLPPEPVRTGRIGVILLGGNDAGTRASLVAAFGPNVAISVGAGPALPNTCDWLLPIHAGDRVSPLLGAVLTAQIAHCGAPLVYWDEDRLAGGRRETPWIKPGWDDLLFGAQDGLVGSCVLRADSLPETPVEDWSRLAYDLAAGAEPPLHLPLILTHRAGMRQPSAPPTMAGLSPNISVVIPTRDRADLLEVCLAGLSRTDFPGDHEVIIVDNDSRESRTAALFERLEKEGIARIVRQPGAFNFAALVNAGVAAARCDLVCLLNNDVEIVASDWLMRMAEFAVRDHVGAVGAQLLYPDGAIQHAGVALGIGDAAGHVDKAAVPVTGIFAPWHGETRTVSAVTAACLLVARSKFEAVGGMDAEAFAVDFNDVDLCLRLAARGWATVYCAHARLIHHESRSRGERRVGADLVRFEKELDTLRTRWRTAGAHDPYHNPLFRRRSERCLLAF